MGIFGLKTYIYKHSDCFLKYYELHDTYLVIDGNNIVYQIYSDSENMNCGFGGDYDKYAQCVSTFFEHLLKCNVIPLVLFDGGSQDDKLKTRLKRLKGTIQQASTFSLTSREKFHPLLMQPVFKDILREKNIQFAQCLFEADNVITKVAKYLNCPVLSEDSDFYMYGIQYIPFNTLSNTIKSPTGEYYMKLCKIYKIEYLLNSFMGLNQSVLPLAAVLIGNDTTEQCEMNNIFYHMESKITKRKTCTYSEYRIEVVLNWLRGYTLEEAIFEILSRTPISMRQRVLNRLEANVNIYNRTAEVLIPLGFPENYNTLASTDSANKIFKFDKDINSLPYIKETYGKTNFQGYKEKEAKDVDEIMNALKPANIAIINNLPVWFINEFQMGKYPGYFMELLIRNLCICPVQLENFDNTSSNIISLKILKVIFGLLKMETNDKTTDIKYIIRNKNNRIACYSLESICPISQSNLREIPLIARRQILDDTLGIINTECIDELLPEWKLYVSTIKYWLEKQKLYKSYKNFVYSIFLCMLFNVIDSKIGKHRSLSNFQIVYNAVIEVIQTRRKTSNYKVHYSKNVNITEAYNEINLNDCLLAAPFFISHFQISNLKKYDISIIHAFAQFQNCLNLSMSLNALLDYPYPNTKIADLYNGTLLYNLTNNFQNCNNVLEYINTVFQNSQSLLRLFHTLLLKTESLFTLQLKRNDIDG